METSNTGKSGVGQPPAYLHQAGRSEKRWMGQTFTYFLATGDTTNDAFCLVDETAQRGESVPLHRHGKDMESFYVLDGEITFFIGDQPGTLAKAGSFVHMPGGTIHGFRVKSDRARYLILTTARHGEFYRAITLPALTDGSAPREEVGGETIRNAVREYGIEFIGALPDAA